MLSEREVSAAIGSPAYGPDGEKIGTVEHFFVDDRTGAPTWAAVATGLFGTRHSVVPATDATFVDGALRLPVGKEAVRSAPHVTGDHLDPADEAELRRHYGLDTAAPALTEHSVWASSGTGIAPRGAGPADDDAAGEGPSTGPGGVDSSARPETDGTAAAGVPDRPGTPADGAMTRSEEQLRIGTERVPTTRARLVKYVVTEEVQITVPVRREEIRVEEVPIDAPDPGPGEFLVPSGDTAGAAAPGTSPIPAVGGPAGGLPEEIVLHAERPVVSVEVVPVERVRLRTEVVTGTERVTEQVEREQIVVDQSGGPRR